ncbi:CAP domain-containing protein [Geodermatophilus obscurus]|uniref:SCP-like extracellular n=1 Tax=Geodermatophilus obscurus (strain ATCC 25078 / DSM 43160 / JCM 3152 / CCUG 61914 / KCC A-0152 / KCTC 9177 / NBRC 13315 / NRRL B-3577 / G-20) TaxID=526225 RepID=D2SD88_GEOOG|nr:CAP domain-containing protein [Geodermatophilus obscurus]ADB76437.1 SCP-like extracellular [Geodermatophilus obscurus DSM 43160]
MTAGRRSALVTVAALLTVLLGGCVAVEVPVSGPAPGPDAPTSTPPPAEASAAEQEMARDVLDRVNDERAERGLAPVEWDEELAAVARSWSAEMARTEQLRHQDMGALLAREELSDLQGIGENVFQSTGPVPAGTMHAGWMRSDDHRVNVVNPGWDRLGVGVHCAEDGSVWATQQFGRTTGSDLPAIATTTPPPEPLVHPEDDGPGCG